MFLDRGRRAELLRAPRAKLHRTQPAVSQAVRRLEDELGERLFDRSSRDGTLTEAGRLLRDYAAAPARGWPTRPRPAVRELRDLRRGRVLIGANEAAVHSLLPLIERFARAASAGRSSTSGACRRARSPREVLERSLDFGVLTFQPAERGAADRSSLGGDELVLLVAADASAGGARAA